MIDRTFVVEYGYIGYLTPRDFAALARPLPRVPRSPPRAAPPLPAGTPPRLALVILDAGAGVANLGVALEDVGGLSTKDVSVVLRDISHRPLDMPTIEAHKKVVSPSISP